MLVKRRNQYTCSLSFLEVSNVINIASNLFSETQTVLNVRNYLSQQYSSSRLKLTLAKKALSFFYNRAEKVICNSEAIKKDLIDAFAVSPSKIDVFYNVFERAALIDKASEQHHFEWPDNTNKRFVYCGRLAPQKGVVSLVNTFVKHLETATSDVLLLIGDGPEIERVSGIVRKYPENIYILGHLANPYPLILESDCLVLNSNFEGFPNVVCESILLGCYPIVADCKSGPREILSNFAVTDYDRELPALETMKLGALYQKIMNEDGINRYLLEALSSVKSLEEEDIEHFYKNLIYLGKQKWASMLNHF